MKAHDEIRHLEWRVRLFGAGALMALVGMWADAGWLVNVALAVLLGGFALRFLPEKDGEGEEEDGEGEGAAGKG